MFKNFIFKIFTLMILGFSMFAQAADSVPSQASEPEFLPAETVDTPLATGPANSNPVVPAKQAAKKSKKAVTTQPASAEKMESKTNEVTPVMVAPAPSETTTPDMAISAPAVNPGKQANLLARETQKDYRYCLDLKTNAEIAACAYKGR